MTQPSFTAQREQLRRGHFIRVVNYHSTPRGARDELELPSHCAWQQRQILRHRQGDVEAMLGK